MKALDDALGSRTAGLAELGQMRVELFGLVEMEPEQMKLASLVQRAQLDTGNDSQPGVCRRIPRRRQAGERVVIGERECAQPNGNRGGDDRFRRECAIGSSRVRMKIDKAFGGGNGTGHHAHLRYPASGDVFEGWEKSRSWRRSGSESSMSDCSRERAPCGE